MIKMAQKLGRLKNFFKENCRLAELMEVCRLTDELMEPCYDGERRVLI